MSEAGVRKSYVDTSGGQMRVRSMAGAKAGAKAGEGVPVVFFHQTASSGQMWLKTMHLLAGEWPMHALDSAGLWRLVRCSGGSLALDDRICRLAG